MDALQQDRSTAVTADNTEVPMLSDIQLHDQGTYLVALERLPLEMQVWHASGTAVCFHVCRACSGSKHIMGAHYAPFIAAHVHSCQHTLVVALSFDFLY